MKQLKFLFTLVFALLTFSSYGQNWFTRNTNILYTLKNVGIGNNDPSEKLDISGNLRVRGFAGVAKITNGDANDFIILDANDESFRIFLNNSEVFSALPNGNIGIGRFIPEARLDIDGSLKINGNLFRGGDRRLNLYSNTGAYDSRSFIELWGDDENRAGELTLAGSYVSFRLDADTSGFGTEKMRITADGSVGIGTTTPLGKLGINGPIHVAGETILFNGTSGSDAFKFRWTDRFENKLGQDYFIFEKNDGNESTPDGGYAFVNKGMDGLERIAMVIKGNNQVGIGTTNPMGKLGVDGPIHVTGETILFNGAPGGDAFRFRWTDQFQNKLGQDYLIFEKNDGNEDTPDGGYAFVNKGMDGRERVAMVVKGNNQVGIGTTEIPNGFKLGVDGKVICEELRVALSQNWPDYVFSEEYELMSLEEVEENINEKGHLPGMPSAEEVEEKGGIEIGEMQRLLLEKIEELTLHMIELKKENEKLKADIRELKN